MPYPSREQDPGGIHNCLVCNRDLHIDDAARVFHCCSLACHDRYDAWGQTPPFDTDLHTWLAANPDPANDKLPPWRTHPTGPIPPVSHGTRVTEGLDCRSGGLHDADLDDPLLRCPVCGIAHSQQMFLLEAGVIDIDGSHVPGSWDDRHLTYTPDLEV